jgi:DNA-binding winged helix-turn-helix (wHTH) protein
MKSTVRTFGQYRLHARERLLERNGVAVAMGSRSLDILIALVERAPEIVDKRELFARIWPNRFVEESNLRCQVSALRRVLDDGQVGCRYVSNVHGRGYCFVAQVSEVAEPDADGSGSAPPSTLPAILVVTC